MSSKISSKAAKRNLKLYPYSRVLSKRVYLPLLPIYFANVSGLSITDLGILAAFVGTVKLILEVPTGYFADHVSRRYSYMLMGVFGMIGTLILVFVQNKVGVFVGMFFETVAYAFFSGAGPALVHDSLNVLGRVKDFAKYNSRTMSFSLIVNAAIIAVVPFTYAIDERLPFLLGTLQFGCMSILSFFLSDVRHTSLASTEADVSLRWLVKNKQFIIFALLFGLFAALYTSPSNFRNLALEAFGVDPSTLGIYFGAASLLGAAMGLFVHHLEKLKVSTFATLDVMMIVIGLFTYSFGVAWIAIAGFMINMSFWRFRGIIYQSHILNRYKTKYKATLLSILFNAAEINGIWLPIVIGVVISMQGFEQGFTTLSIATAILGVPFVLVTSRALSPR